MKYNHLKNLESESIFIIREAFACYKNPVLLYSIGKDSGVLARLCKKAFYPTRVPFPSMHVDTGYKFKEMYEFRDNKKQWKKENFSTLHIYSNSKWQEQKCHPSKYGTNVCCSHLKTEALLDSIKKYQFDAAIGGARREEEKSRAKERIFSIRDKNGQWNPKNQKPELWNLYNTFMKDDETVRVFPLSNWTEIDIWNYIKIENIPVVSLYFAKKRKVINKNNILIPSENGEEIMCRFRSLGCVPCTGAIKSSATTIDDIINELKITKRSERENRIIDRNGDSSMEDKKREGYF